MGVLLARIAIAAIAITVSATSVNADPIYYDKTTCTTDWQPAKAAAFPAVSAFGNARVEVFVNDHGTVDRVQLVEGDPHSALAKQLLAAAPKMKFTPARCNGKVVAELDHLSYRIPIHQAEAAKP
jgi:TonB family protein